MLVRRRILLVGLGIIFIVALAVAPSVYFWSQWQKARAKLAESSGQPVAADILSKVDKLILLPQGEVPTIFSVTEKEKLSGQEFFANAQNGDIVLVYTQAKKAFLYDPDSNKILEVGPVTSSTPSGQVAAVAPTATPTQIRFVLFNGTTIVGLTKSYETALKTKLQNATVVDRDNAKKQDYARSILVDLSGSHPQTQEIANALDLSLDSLPAGESKPQEADFLIILGSDAK